MGELFRRWKRKVGVLTLAIACVFAAGWVRSLSDGDVFSTKLNGEYYTLRSTNSSLQFHHEKKELHLTALSFNGSSLTGEIVVDQIGTLEKSPWWQTFRKFEGNSFLATAPSSIESSLPKAWLSVPFGLIVIPLTLISAWLLLSMPRKSNQKKIIEPAKVQGK